MRFLMAKGIIMCMVALFMMVEGVYSRNLVRMTCSKGIAWQEDCDGVEVAAMRPGGALGADAGEWSTSPRRDAAATISPRRDEGPDSGSPAVAQPQSGTSWASPGSDGGKDPSGQAWQDEESQLKWRISEQNEIIETQRNAIADKQQQLHNIKVEQGKTLLPSQRDYNVLKAKVVDLEETRHKTRAEINSLEQEIEETELSLGYHRSERRRGIPDSSLGDNAAKSSYELEAKRQMTVKESLTRDIMLLKHVCMSHDDQMKRQDQATSRLHQHVTEMKNEYAAVQRTLRQRVESLEELIDKEDEEVVKAKQDLANVRKAESAAYNESLIHGRSVAVSMERIKERDGQTYKKYWDALDHINRLKRDVERVRAEVASKEGYVMSVQETLNFASSIESASQANLSKSLQQSRLDEELPKDPNISYA